MLFFIGKDGVEGGVMGGKLPRPPHTPLQKKKNRQRSGLMNHKEE